MGGKGLGKYWLGRKCCLFTFSLCLGQQRNLNSKPQEFRAPPTKNILYGAMLGAMCEMSGGKRVGEALSWEEVLSFYIQFVLGSAKEFKLKPQKLWAPNHKKASYGAMLGTMCGMHGGKWLEKHWLERKCCRFTFSLCLGQQRTLNSKPQELPAHPQKHFVWCHVRGNVRDVWGKKGWGSTGLGGSAVFLHSVCAWVSKRI